MTSKEIIAQAHKQIAEAFNLITESRKHLTIWEFENHIRASSTELGGKGFIESIGKAIARAAVY